MRLMRRLAPLLVITLVLATFGCRRSNSNGGRSSPRALEEVELRYQATPGTVTPVELAEDLGYLAPIRLKHVSSTSSGPQSIQAVATGDTDFGTAFNGAIIKLVNARAPIRAVLGYYGVDDDLWAGFFVLDGSPLRTGRDLIGKKVAVNTLGAHHEFVLRRYLQQAGLTEAEQRQVALIAVPPVNAEQALRESQVEVAVLSGIFRDRALERGGLRAMFTDRQLFGNFTAGSLVVRNELLEHEPAVLKHFVSAVSRALEWSKSTPRAQVVERFRTIIARRARNEDATVVKYWASYGVEDPGGLIKDSEFQRWLDFLIEAGELKPGQVRLADLYTNQFNPRASNAERRN